MAEFELAPMLLGWERKFLEACFTFTLFVSVRAADVANYTPSELLEALFMSGID